MAPKKKGSKKQADDWDADMGETIDPIAQATADAKNGDEDQAAADEEVNAGGLMAALRKSREKRAKKGKPIINDFVEGEDADGVATPPPAEDLAAKAPTEATFDDEADDVFAANVKKGKGGKKQVEAPAEDGDDGDGGGVKSKKEKEREKKEREKARKREQAAKKKTTAPTPAPKAEEKPVEEQKPELDAPETDKAGKKGRKIPAHLAAIQKQQEILARQREEEARIEAEEKAAEEERLRKEAEEESKKSEARQRKKEKEKEKKEQLRKEGKLLSEADRKRKQQQELRLQQMLEAGVKVAGLTEKGEEKKRPGFEKKRKGPKKEEIDLEAAAEKARQEAEAAAAERQRLAKEAEEAAAAAAATGTEAAKEDDESGLDDWEQAADEEVKDSWDAESDEDAHESAVNGNTKATTNGTATKLSETSKLAMRDGRPPKEKPLESDTSDEDSSEEEEERTSNQRAIAQRKAEAAARRQKAREEALAARSKDNLRSPICCILGHVDTGKTKLLDKIRSTNVQEGEAGGITQQIGATYFPVEALQSKTAVVNKDGKFEFKVPGLLVIDTPGHESFSNLRSRGSSLCNIAILVVDIMHGLEPQTIESMNLLRERKIPFIVALNKIDRLYGWRKIDNNGFQESLAMQNKGVVNEFRDRLEKTKVAFAEQGFNAELYYENRDMRRYVSLVPTSAHTGEGIPDMLKLLVSLTQERMTSSLMYLSEVEATILEVKVIEGLGTTIDVILSNGHLREGDRIVMCGINGPIATNIRALLTPAPLKELRLKSAYVHNKEVKAALGVKVAANDLEGAIAGSRLLVVGPEDDEDDLEDDVMGDLQKLLTAVSKDNRGVSVQASTLGSLEALLKFLKDMKIPVANISIGPVFKRDVMMAGTMLEKAKEYAVMLCFDVKVDKEAQAYADDNGIKIFTADIIYHLFDDFTKYRNQLAEQRKEESKLHAVFPCVLHPLQVFNKKDPIVIGVDVIDGALRPLTPIAAVRTNPVTNVKEIVSLGRVTTIEREHKAIPLCKKGQPAVAIKIEGPNQPLYGRQLDEKDTLYSMISRRSIDTLKEFYRDEVTKEEWSLIKKMKPLFDIP
ncbi:eukaryotic translation initiation factor 5B [Exophiala xenobiotica]|uniref:Eukaryotic translation initiation factor 5B n=1 Tax=Vermiconidia calcicola TaxID=1690605 RepID=A0AAV9PRT9_9PEZI|nr:eukaryotic translation initiation factor 5B [Exophiala xenobiotica]KAK5528429.1 eukaryotic translation initiation factor 5B [Vermiconidia calcicola]KAK5538297.1 eukaryotic translation initiation factor 5B [Chaetothyriales sp. CCFEE 6169]KAK5297876.1 eukaryotic translation initiation factor 5B [Exophiala xenobiotica]KAK5337925.1 eukaryotic translation initiation factor 5B [Exophiala xenobiotica]